MGNGLHFANVAGKKGDFMRARRYDWQVAISGTEQGLKFRSEAEKSTIYFVRGTVQPEGFWKFPNGRLRALQLWVRERH